ncbi:MAG: peptidoglycan-associated lipoprotein Pal [Candidatus Zixiibacteriota bacterium]
MKKPAILAMLAVSLLVIGGCGGGGPKGELGEGRQAGGPGTGTQEGTGEGGAGDRGDVTSLGANYGLKPVYFDFDKYNLREDARVTLDADADILRTNGDLRIVIEGHCDERGTDEYNIALGDRRAKAVQDYLVRLGIDAARISTISYGEERPVSLGHDEDSWRLNRRGEFVVKK